MWRNPKCYPATEAAEPPQETGRRLATFPRARSGEELRLTLSEYEGHPYLALRVWAVSDDGQWFPTRKGCSIRLSEAADLAVCLAEVARQAGRRPALPAGRGQQEPASRPRQLEQPRPAHQSQPGFDEFEEFDGR